MADSGKIVTVGQRCLLLAVTACFTWCHRLGCHNKVKDDRKLVPVNAMKSNVEEKVQLHLFLNSSLEVQWSLSRPCQQIDFFADAARMSLHL